MRKMIREEKLKARELKTKDGNVYHRIFLKKENLNLAKPL